MRSSCAWPLVTFSKVRAVMNSIRPCWKCWTAMLLCLGGRNDGKPARVWSLKIGAAIEHAVAAVKDEVRAELLGVFVDGELVFTTDMKTTPEVRWIADRTLPKHT